MEKTKAQIQVRKLFRKFTDGSNGKFVDNIFYEDNKVEFSKKNKAVISRGNIKYLEEEVLRIIRNSQNKAQPKSI